MDNIAITNHDELGNDTANTTSRGLDGNYAPYGISGYIVNECTVVCPDCLGTEDSDYEDPSPIFGDTESDYPGMFCQDCNDPLDVTLLVYQSNDPELWWRIHQSESLGSYDKVLSMKEIADRISERAYELGYAEAMDLSNEDIDPEQNPRAIEPPTDSAHWANVMAPKLRALSGYVDPTDKGTYTESPIDMAHIIHQEETIEQFRRGYADKALGKESQI